MTTRGMQESDFVRIAEYMHTAVQLAKQIQTAAGSAKLIDFKAAMQTQQFAHTIAEMKHEIQQWSSTFDYPG